MWVDSNVLLNSLLGDDDLGFEVSKWKTRLEKAFQSLTLIDMNETGKGLEKR